MTLYPWRVHDGDEEYTWRWLVWAPDADTAMQKALPWADCELEHLTAESVSSLVAKDGDEPYVERDDEILRDLGFMCESDSSCDTCGLYEMDGKFPVCEECYQCPECGHCDDCETGKEEEYDK
jgi:hypothetical protein